MASHGVPRVSEVGATDDRVREKEAQQIKKYRALVDTFGRRVVAEKNKSAEVGEEPSQPSTDYSSLSTFDLTSKLLVWNPEYYTLWNHRRRLLDAQLSTLPEPEAASTLQADLQFILPLLIKFPKCYWIWNHRLWLLNQTTERLSAARAREFWTEELRLVAQMLARDGRNFHGWGYRRTVVDALESEALAPTTEETSDSSGGKKPESRTQEEFDYTTRMIRTNLSNFSAWHNRSKLIPKLLTERGASASERKAMLDEELTLIQEALYTDPYDQSIWFYHAFLTMAFTNAPHLSGASIAPDLTAAERASYLDAQVGMAFELREDADDCKWVVQALMDMATTQRKQAGRWPEGVSARDVATWLDDLEKLDPLRMGRWKDMKAGLQSLLVEA